MAEAGYAIEESRGHGSRSGLVVGLIFISLGVVFLIDRFYPGLGFISKMWPVVIIAWGLAVFVAGFLPPLSISRVLEGGLIETVGVILLFNTMGKVPFDYWLNLAVLWPVVLIAAGFAILGAVNQSMILRSLAPVTIIATLILALVYQNVIFKDRGMTDFSFSRSMASGIKKGSASMDFSVGKLSLGATNKLYNIDAKEFADAKKPQLDVSQGDSAVDLRIKPQNNVRFLPGNREREWTVLLSRDIDWEFNVKTGVSKSELDLSKLKVNKLNLKGGVGSIKVRFGDRVKKANAVINAGVSQLRVLVPKATGVRLKVNRGISSSDFRNINLRRVGREDDNVFETPDYEQAGKKLNLDIDIGVSNFAVEGY